MAPDEAVAAVMRVALRSTLTAAHTRQQELRLDLDSPVDTFTPLTRGRFSSAEVEVLLRSVSPIAHPHGRLDEIVGPVHLADAGPHHGWPSFRTVATAPTDGELALAISWRLTVPHRESVICEVDNLWVHRVGDPLTLPEPVPERESILVGRTPVYAGLSAGAWLEDGRVPSALLETLLSPPVTTEGGVELLSPAERACLVRVLRALVEHDREHLAKIGAYDDDGDPYRWTRDHGGRGDVHLVMPPGDVSTWPVCVMRVEEPPPMSLLVVDLWTREEGASDLSLELELVTDDASGEVRCRFGNLHVM